MTNYVEVIPNKEAEALIQFDEQAFIDEALDALTELHGSYNALDERLVKMMAAQQRSFAIADAMLYFPNGHLQYTGANGIQPHTWFRIREAANAAILKCRKDLGLDIMTRKPSAKGKAAESSFFSVNLKDKKDVFVSRD